MATGYFATPITTTTSGTTAPTGYTVRWIDWEGTILKTEIVQYGGSATPPSITGITHEHLTFSGWTFGSSIYSAVTSNLDIGAYYSDDGATYLYIEFDTSGGTTGTISFNVTTTNQLWTFDWGDGTTTTGRTTGNSTTNHTYSNTGATNYVIKITSQNEWYLGNIGTTIVRCLSNTTILRKVIYGGGNTTRLGYGTFDSMINMEAIHITYLKSTNQQYNYPFQNCYALRHFTVHPKASAAFANSSSGPSYTFYNSGLKTFCAPESFYLSSLYLLANTRITDIDLSPYVSWISATNKFYYFYNCSLLKSVILSNKETVINNGTFQGCGSLSYIYLPSGLTSLNTNCFDGCISLTGLTLPNGITSIATYAFQNCYNLTNIQLPSALTSIGTSAFNGNYSLINIDIPSGVTSIGATAFQNCYSLNWMNFLPTTPPTITSTTFTNLTKRCKIYVPDANINNYKTATNWSAISYLIYPVSQKP